MAGEDAKKVDLSAIERVTEHRPWPLPEGPWVMTMTWLDSLLAHWPVEPSLLEPTIPDRLTLDTREGRAWVTVVPFEMANTTVRGLTRLPGQLRFPELNLRTYVTVDGEKPGIWFYSLDATSWLTVTGARTFMNLPYFLADIDIGRGADGTIDYRSRRTHPGASEARFDVRYRATGPPSPAPDRGIDGWLAERYCLYTQTDSGAIYRLEIHHHPWPLRRAEAEFRTNTLDANLPCSFDGPPELLHVADRLDVLGWWPEQVAS